MISLRESLLTNTKDKVSSISGTISKIALFGNVFQLKNVYRLRTKNIACLSAKGLKDLTKGMDFIDWKVERGVFDRANKVRNLINYIEHINLIEWGFVDVDWNNDKVRGEFASKLWKTLQEHGGFNGNGYCWCTNSSITGKDVLRIMFDKVGGNINDYFAIEFELKK